MFFIELVVVDVTSTIELKKRVSVEQLEEVDFISC
jgi:hypothetical protein